MKANQRLPMLLTLLLLATGVQEASAFYNPQTGRWLNRDPLGENGGKNVCGFVAQNPISSIDSTGLDITTPSPWPGFPPPNPPPIPYPLPLPEVPVKPHPPCPPSSPACGTPPQMPPSNPPGVPPGRPPGAPPSNPGSAAGGAVALCANNWNTIFNRWEYQDGVRACRASMGSQTTGPKCCVIVLCAHCGCASGRTSLTRVASFLDSQPCQKTQADINSNKFLMPSCTVGDCNDIYYEPM